LGNKKKEVQGKTKTTQEKYHTSIGKRQQTGTGTAQKSCTKNREAYQGELQHKKKGGGEPRDYGEENQAMKLKKKKKFVLGRRTDSQWRKECEGNMANLVRAKTKEETLGGFHSSRSTLGTRMKRDKRNRTSNSWNVGGAAGKAQSSEATIRLASSNQG